MARDDSWEWKKNQKMGHELLISKQTAGESTTLASRAGAAGLPSARLYHVPTFLSCVTPSRHQGQCASIPSGL